MREPGAAGRSRLDGATCVHGVAVVLGRAADSRRWPWSGTVICAGANWASGPVRLGVGTLRDVPSLETPTTDANDWVALTTDDLDVGRAYEWAVRPGCGAVVVFSGTVRDHADGRNDVTHLTYEAYEDKALERMSEIIVEARRRWPVLERVALLHRVGRLTLGESSVLVVVSSPHRPEAFEAGRFCIDTLKVAVPIWKQEEWSEGTDWGTGASEIVPVTSLSDAASKEGRA